MSPTLVVGNFIAGQWRPSGRLFERRNPATFEVVARAARSGPEDVAEAVEAARSAFDGWRALSRIKRGEYLDKFAEIVKQNVPLIAEAITRESGKPINEARADVIEGLHTAQYWFGRSRMSVGEVFASEVAEKESYALRKPKGVVAAITPWNFPFAIPLWLICPSLLEGNTVVLKPAEQTPMSADLIAHYFQQAGLPPGVLNVVQGFGEEAGWPLVVHPQVDVVLFTGSYTVGSAIKRHCAADYRKFAVCEMGGKNASIVCHDADIDLAVQAAILSCFKTAGQRCVSASRIIVQEGVLKEFEEKFVAAAASLRMGDPMQEDVFLGPVVSEEAMNQVLAYNDVARHAGFKVLLDGGRWLDPKGARGHFLTPFIYEAQSSSPSPVLREEVFGPHVAVIPFRTLEEAAHIYNNTPYGFSLSIMTEDYRRVKWLRDNCDFGVCYVNLPTIGAEVHIPFGGIKRSGSGMPSASALADAVTHRVTVTVNYGQGIQLAQGLSANLR